jgi:RNA polymerase sigma-70 factor, ECF subfamily
VQLTSTSNRVDHPPGPAAPRSVESVRAGAALTCRPPGDLSASRARRRDTEADRLMRLIYQAHVPPLFRYLLRLTQGDQQVAEDLLQETLLRAWRNIDQLVAEPSSARPWLFTVARNHAIDVIRSRQARPELGMTDAARVPASGDAVELLLNATAVRRALKSLTPDHRAVIVELYFRDATLAQAAQRLAIPAGTVKSRAHYALRALRGAIGSIDLYLS